LHIGKNLFIRIDSEISKTKKLGEALLALLDVQNLTTYYDVMRGYVKAVENVNFSVEKGEAVGLAGESGCGKTTIALSVLRLLPSGGRIVKGKVLLDGTDLTKLDDYQMRRDIRWKEIAIVFQGAMNALNPVFKISDQITESILAHETGISKAEALERGKKLFELVGIEPSRIENYPHEFSGGMRQRAMIAMALSCNPKLLIADEPGTALDVIVQAQVLKLLQEIKKKLNLSMILITHDLSIIVETCDKAAIMYAGKMVEFADVYGIFKEPLHPYTQGLTSVFPDVKAPRQRMTSIPGLPPDLLYPPPACRFHPRCPYAMDICRKKEPAFTEYKKDHFVACHLVT
jgi:peptide/nickel transport system ATP-binding protein